MESHDATASSSSSFLKTVCLYDWWLVKSKEEFEGKRLAVAGLTSRDRQQAVRVFSSAPIIKRYDVFTLETADRICVVLKSFINKPRTTENGFSDEVFSHFVFGFPPHWEEYADEKYLGGESTRDVSKRNSGFDELATDSGSMRNSSPTSMPPLLQEGTPNKYNGAIFEERHDKREDILNETNVRLEDNGNILLANNHSNIRYSARNESALDAQREYISECVYKKIIDDASKDSNLQNHGADSSVDISSGVSTSHDKNHPGFSPRPVNINADRMKNDASKNSPLSHIHYSSCNEYSLEVQREYISQNVSKKIIDDASDDSNLQNHGADFSVDIGTGVSTSHDKGHPDSAPSPANINADSMKKDASKNSPLSPINYSSCNEDSVEVQRVYISQNVSKKIIDGASEGSNLQNHGTDFSVDIGSGVYTSHDKGHPGSAPSPANINAVGMENDASKNSPLSIGSDANTVHSVEVNIAVPEEPSRHQSVNCIDDTLKYPIEEKLKRSSATQVKIAVGERDSDAKGAGTFGKKAKRKLKYDNYVSPITREGKKKASIVSPEAMSFKRSRSGRLLVPPLDFWRNQMAVYNADGQITGIHDPS